MQDRTYNKRSYREPFYKRSPAQQARIERVQALADISRSAIGYSMLS